MTVTIPRLHGKTSGQSTDGNGEGGKACRDGSAWRGMPILGRRCIRRKLPGETLFSNFLSVRSRYCWMWSIHWLCSLRGVPLRWLVSYQWGCGWCCDPEKGASEQRMDASWLLFGGRANLMQKSGLEAPVIAQVSGVEFRGEVFFDPELLLLEGRYSDELCAHRARRGWVGVFSASFLLEAEHDYVLSVEEDDDEEVYALRCSFVSACGRYAFWRLTHGQAPDAQHLLELAHVPGAESRSRTIAFATDLRPAKRGSSSGGERRAISGVRWIEWGAVARWIVQRRVDLRRFYRQLFH